MELRIMQMFMKNKEFVNPGDSSQTFSCIDIAEGTPLVHKSIIYIYIFIYIYIYIEFSACRASKRRMKDGAFSMIGTSCLELRMLATKCFVSGEEEVAKLIMKKYQEKLKFIEFLDKEGSLLTDQFKMENNALLGNKIM